MRRLSNLIFTIFMVFIAFTPAAYAKEQEVNISLTVYLYGKDPTQPSGYREVYRWAVTSPEDILRYNNSVYKLPPIEGSDNVTVKVDSDELIVLSFRSRNGVTGQDVFITPKKVVVNRVYTRNTYTFDHVGLYELLRSEFKKNVSITDKNQKPLDVKAKGLVLQYNLSRSLPTPPWYVTDTKKIEYYNAYFKETGKDLMNARQSENIEMQNYDFEEDGSFVLYLNYKGAPADMVFITNEGYVRFSDVKSVTRDYKDNRHLWAYFRNEADQIRRVKKSTEQADIEQQLEKQF